MGKGGSKSFAWSTLPFPLPDAVWTYPDPKPEAEHIRGRVAFWNGVEVVE